MEIDNQTPFEASPCAVADLDGADLLVVILKATYSLDGQGGMALAEAQRPVELADVFTGEPGVSSVAYASDLSVHKTATDVVLAGHAYPPRPGEREAEVGVQVGTVKASARVFGDREWQSAMGARRISRPAPIERIPLCYERAAGGTDLSPADPRDHGYEPRNPVGLGFRARRSRQTIDAMRLPNFEDPAEPIRTPQDQPPPAAVGFVAPGWAPRSGFAGTYEDVWAETRQPLLPTDFDARYFNTAPPALTAAGFLRGDEHGAALGISSHGLLRFTLPRVLPSVEVAGRTAGRETVSVNLDRVFIDGDGGSQGEVVLVWSGGLRLRRGLHDVQEIAVGLS